MIPSFPEAGQHELKISITPLRPTALTNRASIPTMTDDAAIKTAVNRFLKNVNFTAEREIEKAVRKALAAGKLQGGENLTTSVTLANETLDLNVTIFNKIEL
jgi:hypothetical protein